MAAEQAGNLSVAREQFQQAYQRAQTESLGPGPAACALYEWSRITGYMGSRAESEKGFLTVLDLIDKSAGQAEALRAPTLCELARLLHDTGQHARAIPIYEKALVELHKRGAPQKDPFGFVEFLDDYALSLRAVGDHEIAKAVSQRSAAIKEDNSAAASDPLPKARRYTK